MYDSVVWHLGVLCKLFFLTCCHRAVFRFQLHFVDGFASALGSCFIISNSEESSLCRKSSKSRLCATWTVFCTMQRNINRSRQGTYSKYCPIWVISSYVRCLDQLVWGPPHAISILVTMTTNRVWHGCVCLCDTDCNACRVAMRDS
jgi:hypothetical protein